MEPRGATEIQHELLEKYVSKELLDNFQICTSIPGKVLDKTSKSKLLKFLWVLLQRNNGT